MSTSLIAAVLITIFQIGNVNGQFTKNCGLFDMDKPEKQSLARIVGGEDAKASPPWMVRISVFFYQYESVAEKESQAKNGNGGGGSLMKDDDGDRTALRPVLYEQNCGGSVIDEYNVVTACHCFYVSKDQSLKHIDIDFGGRSFVVKNETWKPSGAETKGQFQPKQKLHGIDPKNAICHDNYQNNRDYDIALVHLPIRVDLAQLPDDEQRVRPICQPDWHDFEKEYINTDECYVTGWGKLCEKGPVPEALQQAKMLILDNVTCAEKLKAWNSSYNKNITLCAGNMESGEPSTCRGDSGGPLHCRMMNSKTKWYLMGVVNGAQDFCGKEQMPIKFARVFAHTAWIDNNKKKSAEQKKAINAREFELKRRQTNVKRRGIIYLPDDGKKVEEKKPEPSETSKVQPPKKNRRPQEDEPKPDEDQAPDYKPKQKRRRRPRKHRPSKSDDESEPDEDQEPEHDPRPRRKRPSENQYSGGNQIIITNNNLNQNLEDSLNGSEMTTKQLQETTTTIEEPRHKIETKEDKPKNRKKKIATQLTN